MHNNKKGTVFMIIGLALLMILVIGASYAYFQAAIGTGSTSSINITSKTVDSLSFVKGAGYNEYRTGTITADSTFHTTSHTVNGTLNTGDLSFTFTQANFGEGAGDMCSYITPYVTLKARNDAASAYTYRVLLTIGTEEDGFVYTNGSTPELVLNVIKEEYNTAYNNNIRDGKAAAVSSVWIYQNFDITTKTGLGMVIPNTENATSLNYTASNHIITANANAIKTYVFRTEICIKNLSSNQSDNAGKTIAGSINMSKV